VNYMRLLFSSVFVLALAAGSLIGAVPGSHWEYMGDDPIPQSGAKKAPDTPPAYPLTIKADDPKAPPKEMPKKHPTGYKAPTPEVLKARHAAAFERHGHRVKNLPRVTAAAFDCRTAPGYVVLGTDDQGQCGDCFGVSAADVCSMCLARAGLVPASEAGRLSSQYGLDNQQAFSGGCNGGDEAQVIDFIKTNGFPLTKDYGPYTANPGNLKPLTGMQVFKIGDWGYCTPSQQQGIAAVADIKACMVQYGPISWAGDAGQFNNYVWPSTIIGNGGNVDHATIVIAWDDNHDNGDGTKGAWLCMNQWGQADPNTVTFTSGPWGGPGGTAWIKYNSDSWGTEAIWVTAGTPPPPPPPPPGPPIPPVPAAGTYTLVVNPDGSITLTPVVAGGIYVTRDMTLKQVLDAFNAAQQKSPPLKP
jgi:hypothetical protein